MRRLSARSLLRDETSWLTSLREVTNRSRLTDKSRRSSAQTPAKSKNVTAPSRLIRRPGAALNFDDHRRITIVVGCA